MFRKLFGRSNPIQSANTASVAVLESPLTPTQRILVALADDRFTYRSIEALTKASGLSELDTRDILESLTVRRNNAVKESYTVKA